MSDALSSKMEKFVIRMPEGMRDRIRDAAERNNRSMNSEVVATLERAYPLPSPQSDYDEVIAQVLKDGQSRVLSRDGVEVHFSKSDDGRVILDVIDNHPIKDAN